MNARPLALALALTTGLVACSADEETTEPAPTETTRRAGSLDRTLPAPIAIPIDNEIGHSIDDLVTAREGALTSHPSLDIGANGSKCNIVRYDDDKGVEKMRRERCESTDMLRVGTVTYRDRDRDGKIDELTTGDDGYELLDEDRDGKVDRMIESIDRIAPPPSLGDFAPDVTIAAGGTLASRTREDRDHDGRFDFESLTATTSFEIHTIR